MVGRQSILKQAGAELCQAQAQVDLPDEAEFIVTVEFQNWTLLEKVICAHFLQFPEILVIFQ
jgi:hypothetical protein